MTAEANGAIDEILAFWFGPLDANGRSAEQQQSLWFKKNSETDAIIRAKFANLLDRALAGELDDWAEQDTGLIALIVLLDQFSRNVHRDQAAAFAGDDRALNLALAAIAQGRHHTLPAIHRVFLYLPLEHSEDLAVQRQCVALFDELCQSGDEDMLDFRRYAQAHHDVIAQFGRFPHRNAILGRHSSAAELAYLSEHGGF